MSRFEKPLKLGKNLFELNNETLIKIVELSTENFKKYLEMNQSYVEKLPEVRDMSTFVELQREYGQNLWEAVQEDLRTRGSIVREAVENTTGLIRGAFGNEEAAVEVQAA